jgi:hypothetical protein
MNLRALVTVAALLAVPVSAGAYPGGTPNFQNDVAPYCAGCHSSRDVDALAGAGDRAEKEVAEKKHLAVILSGKKGYADLSESDRAMLADQIRALDAATTISVEAPASVAKGATFQVTVTVTGGAGPVLGVMLLDRAHRWYGRPISSAGWAVAGPPVIIGSDGQPQSEWLHTRPDGLDRNLSYVNITGISSDAATGQWANAKVIFTLRAPAQAGAFPLTAALLYGTEKASVLGYTTNAMGWKVTRGGMTGGSGRVLFAPLQSIVVE